MNKKRSTQEAILLLEDMVRINSVNPAFDPSGKGERELACYVEGRLKRAGLHVWRQTVFAGRDNIIAEWRTGHPERTLLFEAHMDTVAPGSMGHPFNPRYEGDLLYARGACDTKGSLAGMLWAMEYLAAQGTDTGADVILCASVDEEHQYRGLMKFLEWDIPIAAAVVGEPTGLEVVSATKGCVRFAIATHGKAAHSSVAHEGDSAIFQMVPVLNWIREVWEKELQGFHHPLCGTPTLTVGKIQGGTQVNIVPESCRIEIDYRIIPGYSPEQTIAEAERRLRQELRGESVNLSFEPMLIDWTLETSIDENIVQCALAVSGELGLGKSPTGVPFGTDASKLQHFRRIPSIVFGPGHIAQAHARNEYISTAEVEKAALFYLQLVHAFGKSGGPS